MGRKVADLARERERRLWPEASLDAERRFGHPAARLYPFIDRVGAVRTPLGLGTVRIVRSGSVMVELVAERKTIRYRSGREVPIMREFALEDVLPTRRGKRA